MKSLSQQLTEKVAVLRARGKGEAVDTILTESSEYTIEAQLLKLQEYEQSLRPTPTKKNNGVSDNGRHKESFSESGNEFQVSDVEAKKKVAAAAREAFGLTEAESLKFAGIEPSGVHGRELQFIEKAVLGRK